MQAYALTDIGVEDSTRRELEAKLDVEAEVFDTVVRFDADLLDICEFIYTGQSVRRVLAGIADFSFEDLEDISEASEEALSNHSLEEWFDEDTSFRILCERLGDHAFSSRDVSVALGDYVVDSVEEELGFQPEVDLDDPDLIIYAYIHDDRAWIGVDLCGRDLSQRNYKVFSHPTSIRGNIAYSLVSMSGFDKEDVLLDPFCGAASIPLEAFYHASRVPVHSQNRELDFVNLFDEEWDDWFRELNSRSDPSGVNIYAFDENLQNLDYGKKNAKAAAVDDFIEFSKLDVEWLDTRLDENEVDVIVTHPPQNSQSRDEQVIEDVYDEFFYQADFVLNDEGCIVALMLYTELLEGAAEKHGFEVVERREIRTGDLEYEAVKLKANS